MIFRNAVNLNQKLLEYQIGSEMFEMVSFTKGLLKTLFQCMSKCAKSFKILQKDVRISFKNKSCFSINIKKK